jgi:hypothetical protein
MESLAGVLAALWRWSEAHLPDLSDWLDTLLGGLLYVGWVGLVALAIWIVPLPYSLVFIFLLPIRWGG